MNHKAEVKYIRLPDGKILSLEKKYYDLSRSQKEWIMKRLGRSYNLFLRNNERKPNKEEMKEIFYEVYEKIETKGIQISKEQIWIFFNKKLYKILEFAIKDNFKNKETFNNYLRSYGLDDIIKIK